LIVPFWRGELLLFTNEVGHMEDPELLTSVDFIPVPLKLSPLLYGRDIASGNCYVGFGMCSTVIAIKCEHGD